MNICLTSFVATGVNEIIASLVLSVIGAILGGFGLIYGLLDITKAKVSGNKGFTVFAELLSVISLGFTITSIKDTVCG